MTTQSDPKNPVASPRKGAKTGVVSELSVFLKVKPGHEKQIREVFTRRAATSDWHVQATRVLVSVGTVHEARQVLFDNDTRLLIATSFDGDIGKRIRACWHDEDAAVRKGLPRRRMAEEADAVCKAKAGHLVVEGGAFLAIAGDGKRHAPPGPV